MANDTYQLTIVGQSAGQFYENVLCFKNTATADPDPTTTASQLIAGYRAIVEEFHLECLCVDTDIHGYKARRLNNGGSPTIAEPIAAVPGTVAGTSATSATASLILTPFIRSSKFYSGKIFLPGLSESVLAGNVIAGGQRTKLGDFTDALASFTSSPHTWTYVIWSKTVGLPFVPYDFTISAKVGIQRRRLKPVM